MAYTPRYLSRASPFSNPSPASLDTPLLLVGAGGIGCELLKNVVLAGHKNIHIVDMDTISSSNLNRQFLFRPHHVGKLKAESAAETIRSRYPGVKITCHSSRVEQLPSSVTQQTKIMLSGLDNVEARRYVNSLVHTLHSQEDPYLMIDAGSEGFQGHCRRISPFETPCFECGTDLFGAKETVPVCTVASTPRQPQHCVIWALLIKWKQCNDEEYDKDNNDHVDLLTSYAIARANEHGIHGVNRAMVAGVAGNIIPAVASTNSIVSAQSSLEAFKYCMGMPLLDNFCMWNGTDGGYSCTLSTDVMEGCLTCGLKEKNLKFDHDPTLQEVLDTDEFKYLEMPAISSLGKTLYMSNPPFLKMATKKNLSMRMSVLGVKPGDELVLTAKDTDTMSIKLEYPTMEAE